VPLVTDAHLSVAGGETFGVTVAGVNVQVSLFAGLVVLESCTWPRKPLEDDTVMVETCDVEPVRIEVELGLAEMVKSGMVILRSNDLDNVPLLVSRGTSYSPGGSESEAMIDTVA
jgi:hypothetical protein